MAAVAPAEADTGPNCSLASQLGHRAPHIGCLHSQQESSRCRSESVCLRHMIRCTLPSCPSCPRSPADTGPNCSLVTQHSRQAQRIGCLHSQQESSRCRSESVCLRHMIRCTLPSCPSCPRSPAAVAAAALLRSLRCPCHRHSSEAHRTFRRGPTGMSPRHHKAELVETVTAETVAAAAETAAAAAASTAVAAAAETAAAAASTAAAAVAAAALLRSLRCPCHHHSNEARHTVRHWPTGMSPRHHKAKTVEAPAAAAEPEAAVLLCSQSCPCRDRSHPPAHRSSHRSQTRMSLGSRRHRCLQGRTWERRTPRPPRARTPPAPRHDGRRRTHTRRPRRSPAASYTRLYTVIAGTSPAAATARRSQM
eukprot:COSAG06_NODE_3810_length_4886_cov_97.704617_1_plen_365_part_00